MTRIDNDWKDDEHGPPADGRQRNTASDGVPGAVRRENGGNAMGELSYTCAKLSAGVQTLATHPGRVKERLIAAFHDSLFAVNQDALPDEPKSIWLQVWEKATSIKGSSLEGSYAPSINCLDEAGAVELTKMITTVQLMAARALRNE